MDEGGQTGRQASRLAGRKEGIAPARWNGRARRESRHSRARSGVPRVLTECPREKSKREWEGESERKSEQAVREVTGAERCSSREEGSCGSGARGRTPSATGRPRLCRTQNEGGALSPGGEDPCLPPSPTLVIPRPTVVPVPRKRESRTKLGTERERAEREREKRNGRRKKKKAPGANQLSPNYSTSSRLLRGIKDYRCDLVAKCGGAQRRCKMCPR